MSVEDRIGDSGSYWVRPYSSLSNSIDASTPSCHHPDQSVLRDKLKSMTMNKQTSYHGLEK